MPTSRLSLNLAIMQGPGQHIARTKNINAAAHAASDATISSYERFAAEYDKLCDDDPPPAVRAALERMVRSMPAGGSVLEVGSGPGRDANFLESLGARVRRTDATQAFLDIQAARGKRAERLDLLTDALGGPYDGVLALCTVMHIERQHTQLVLSKIADALAHDGVFLVSMREGEGETSGDYQMTYWSHASFGMRLEAAGFRIEASERRVDESDDVWLTYLCRRIR